MHLIFYLFCDTLQCFQGRRQKICVQLFVDIAYICFHTLLPTPNVSYVWGSGISSPFIMFQNSMH